jgi:hypothetical protein
MPCEIGDNVPLPAHAACSCGEKATLSQETITTELLGMDASAGAVTEPDRS